MIDLRQKGLLKTVEIEGKPFIIKTDFREWIKFGELIQDKKTLLGELYYLFPEETPNAFDALPVLLEFYINSNITPKQRKGEDKKKIFDYVLDGEYIVSSFMQAYQINLTEIEYMHWHLFLALFRGLPADTKICEIMSLRSYNKSSESQEHRLTRLRNDWSFPIEVTPEEKELLDEINNEFYGC